MKHFRIIPKDVSRFYSDMQKHIRYTIEQRHTVLFFFHWWSTPDFAPPHSFMNLDEAIIKVRENPHTCLTVECKNVDINVKDLLNKIL